MPRGQFRSGHFRRVWVKTPGSKSVIHYRERKPKKAHCGSCGSLLSGVPREKPSVMRRLPKTAKRPERPYGGVLCSRCMREKFRSIAREMSFATAEKTEMGAEGSA